LALALAPHAQHVQVWAGPGNNGGDGLVAARLLHQAGRIVSVTLLADETKQPTDAAQALQRLRDAGIDVHAGAAQTPAQVHIDALLGLGARRAPAGALLQAVQTMNAASVPVLAIDLPTGLNPDTGALLGSDAVRAAATLSLLTLKPGCFTAHGRDHAGVVWLDNLDVDVGPPCACLSGSPEPARRQHATHKGRYGDAVVVGGAPGMTGAAWLAARAALAAGAGRVYCSLLDTDAPLLDPQQPELMGRRAWWQSPAAVLASATVACGCGGGTLLGPVLPALLSRVPRLVLDADALNALAAQPAWIALVANRQPGSTVLTPHPLEAARLLGSTTAAVQADRLTSAQTLANQFGCTVVLKGSGSVIAAPGQIPHINPTGNARLATAGTGDVLAGLVGSLMAQGHPGWEAACLGAYRHGQVADNWQLSQTLTAAILAKDI
ncbi:MAG: NAD(P)H-hydrate dehydratase, partial [Rhodoferax sp.]|nr:NAD(P)H-hydrate dehydratase [Rhodoferax sp.]